VALVDALGTAAQARLKSAEARLREAQVNHDVAERERLRIEGLYHTGVVSEKESNDATAEGLRTAASVDARSAEAAEEQAELARLSIILKKAEVRSPFAGVVTARYVEVGQWVKQGDPIAEIVQLDPLYVRVQVPEAIIARVRTGDQAKVTIDAVGGDELIGKVDQVIPEADRASRTFAVRILLPNPERRIWPGFFGRAVLTASSAGPQLVVPRDAVVSNGTAHHVVVVRGGTAALVPVSMGVRLDSGVAVQGGLQAGEVVVIRGNEALRGGEALVVLNPVQAPADAASAGASTPASQPAPGG
jgi:RND family efflux transporter MFP subunit